MRRIAKVLFGAAAAVAVVVCVGVGASNGDEPARLRVYEVGRSASLFPEAEDFSTPEGAYAAISRMMAGGDQAAWRKVSVRRIALLTPREGTPPRKPSPEYAATWRNARIVEVRVYRGRRAVVLAEIIYPNGTSAIDLRSVEMENGRWLNAGQDIAGSLLEARSMAGRQMAQWERRRARGPVADAEAHVAGFVKFLKSSGEEPGSFVRKALAEHKLVIMGEVHHRPRYWAFNSQLVSEPGFPETVGVIYMELPANDQDLVDNFLASEELDTEPVIEMLRDMLWMGWPDQAMLDFFTTVWQVNTKLPAEKRLRIVLVDMQRPWKNIRKRGDWAQYERTPRDRQMADNILRDLESHSRDGRNALFIVGVGHAMLDMEYFEEAPMMSAGWHLRRELGADEVYAIFPHMPVQTNTGRVDGRLCMGLFDSAFEALGKRPVAFGLDVGPFGEEIFDAMPDMPTADAYRDGYSAYLYLGPLEDEIFSPLIGGFYTDEVVREADRRHRLLFGKGWAESYGRTLNAESFIEWMKNDWGKVRSSWKNGA